MLIYDKRQAITVMDELGTKGIPFRFLIDFEMKKIIISTKIQTNSSFKFNINGFNSHEEAVAHHNNSFLESYPEDIDQYSEKFAAVKNEIQLGNSFLLNLSTQSKIITNLSLLEIYNAVDAKYKIYLEDNFVCFSPEIFVQIKNGKISSFPMKGTIDANIINAEQILLEDSKELAEHYTIVDLIRNDLSRVAKNVRVDRFRYIEKITTSQKDLLQISSEVSGKLPNDYTQKIGSILFNLLPAGSISGAPKPKTLEIIKKVEGQDRGYYTGICGYFDGQNLDSGVMIRFIEQVDEGLYYRSGGGLTSMSDLNSEYQEMIDKIYLPHYERLTINPSISQIGNNEN